MSNTLFDIVGEFQDLYEMATEEDIDPIAFENTLESLTAELEAKAAGCAAVMQQLKMEMDKAEELEQKFQAIKISRKNAWEKMKEYVKTAMVALGKDEIPAGDFTFKLRGNGGKRPLKITGEVPESFKKVVVEDDNEKIREYLKKQKDNKCEWAMLEERGKQVRIV